MLEKGFELYRWSAVWRAKFGLVRGLEVAAALRRAMWAARPGTVVPVPVPGLPHPVLLRARTSDADVFEQIFADEQAHIDLTGSPRLIIDAGANIGLTAVLFAHRYPDATVVALEVDADNFGLLERNTRPYSNIVAWHRGLWHGVTRMKIANPDARAWAYRGEEAEGEADSVAALGVADILDELGFQRADLVKIDIEGGEIEIFTVGVERWIDRVDTIAVETHDVHRPGCSAAVRGALATHGYRESTSGEYLVFRREEEPSVVSPAIA
jgi:FkbM family methyltransferase